MRKAPFHVLGCICLVLTCSVMLFAGAEGRFGGRVVDSAGKPVPEATIVLTSDEALDYRKEVKIRGDGTFVALLLDATRSYNMRVEAPGFVPWMTTFKIGVGSTDKDNQFLVELSTAAEMVAQEQNAILSQPGYKELGEAQEALESGDVATARAKLEAALAAKPDLVAAQERLAEILLDADEAEAALAAIDGRHCKKSTKIRLVQQIIIIVAKHGNVRRIDHRIRVQTGATGTIPIVICAMRCDAGIQAAGPRQ